VAADELRILGDGGLAGAQRLVEIGGGLDEDEALRRPAGDLQRTLRRLDIDFSDRGHRDAGHVVALGHDVSAHFAGPDQTDPDWRLRLVEAALQIDAQAAGRPNPVCGHATLPACPWVQLDTFMSL